jgi:phosphate ABC transporter phosphate-binding protein
MIGKPMIRSSQRPRRVMLALAAIVAAMLVSISPALSSVEAQEGYQAISGEGSSWSANAIDAMRVNVKQFGITVNYASTGSTAGRKNWLNGTADFAASDIPFQFAPEDGSAPENPTPNSYVYIPVTAGGTAFMYNLKINGQRVSNLRLSGANVAKIFTGEITTWNDPALAADNPGLALPARPIVPVVRSDGSGSTAQFTEWMIKVHGGIWQSYCAKSGRAPACGQTSFYPTIPGMQAQAGDLGVAGYVAQGFAEGSIGYVNYSYALNAGFPVVKVLNKAGFYTEPTPENVAVSLLQARINTDESNPAMYLTQQLDGVYGDGDPRSYQLSSYSYFILPTKEVGQFTTAKGRTLGAFAYYAMCQAQQESASLGYSPLPINLVDASLEQIRKIPGVVVQDINIQACNNPTFSPDGTNVLAANAPQPKACDQAGPAQCPDGTAGLLAPTAVATPAAGGGGGGESASGGGAADGGGASTGTATTGGGTAAQTTSTSGGAQTTTGSASSSTTGSASTTGSSGSSTTGGTTGTGAATGADTTGGSAVDTTLGGSEVCDPETGACTIIADVNGDPSLATQTGSVDQTASPVSAGATQTAVLPQNDKAATLLFTLLVVLAAFTVIFGPALYWRSLSAKKAVPS